MKKSPFLLLLFSLFISSCREADTYDLVFEFSNNELHKLYYGNTYYRINGFTSLHNDRKYKLTKPGDFLILESDSFEFNGHDKVVLIEDIDSLSLSLHDLNTINAQHLNIRFNRYIHKEFVALPVYSLEFLEKSKNRSALVLGFDDSGKLKPVFAEDGFTDKAQQSNLEELDIHASSLKNIEALADLNIHPSSTEDIYLVYNPLDNKYSIFPDVSKFKYGRASVDISKIIPRSRKTQPEPPLEKKKILVIKRDTVITKNWEPHLDGITIMPGTIITIEGTARLSLEKVDFKALGTKENPIWFIASDTNAIRFANCDTVLIKNTYFEGFSNLVDSEMRLPSGVTFYNSNVVISKSEFNANKRGDDYVNFYNCQFEVDSCLFNSVVADAIDSDFSKGTIKNTEFRNVGNDAVDLSGSELKIHGNIFLNTSDKSISLGEDSFAHIKGNNFETNELGIVIKDGSKAIIENNRFNNNRLDLVMFKKKSFYGEPFAEVGKNVNMTRNLIENKSILKCDSLFVYDRMKDIEEIMYGVEYGRASK